MACYFFFFFLPALDIAIATACFWGLPASTSVRIFELIVFLLDPDLSGINTSKLKFNATYAYNLTQRQSGIP